MRNWMFSLRKSYFSHLNLKVLGIVPSTSLLLHALHHLSCHWRFAIVELWKKNLKMNMTGNFHEDIKAHLSISFSSIQFPQLGLSICQFSYYFFVLQPSYRLISLLFSWLFSLWSYCLFFSVISMYSNHSVVHLIFWRMTCNLSFVPV